MLVPASAVNFAPETGVLPFIPPSSCISDQAAPLDPPPQPAKDTTGLVTGLLKLIVITPRLLHRPTNSVAIQPLFEVYIIKPGSVTRPTDWKSPARPPRELNDSVARSIHK